MQERIPTVSIIIPSYNYGRFIGRALNSVLSQSYQDYEIIIVDDASTDDTKDVVGKYNDPRIRYIVHPVNCGPSKARNTGIEASKGRYIAFLDSDDIWMPEKIESQIGLFQNGPDNLGVVYTNMKVCDETTSKTFSTHFFAYRGKVLQSLLEVNHVGNSGVMIKKECFAKAGLFDVSMRLCEDWDMWIRVACFDQFDCIEQPLFTLFTHSSNSSANLKQMISGRETLLQKHAALYRRYPKIHSLQYYILGIQCFREGLMARGRKHFLRALKYSDPWDISIKLRSIMQIFASAAGFKGYTGIKRMLGF